MIWQCLLLDLWCMSMTLFGPLHHVSASIWTIGTSQCLHLDLWDISLPPFGTFGACQCLHSGPLGHDNASLWTFGTYQASIQDLCIMSILPFGPMGYVNASIWDLWDMSMPPFSLSVLSPYYIIHTLKIF